MLFCALWHGETPAYPSGQAGAFSYLPSTTPQRLRSALHQAQRGPSHKPLFSIFPVPRFRITLSPLPYFSGQSFVSVISVLPPSFCGSKPLQLFPLLPHLSNQIHGSLPEQNTSDKILLLQIYILVHLSVRVFSPQAALPLHKTGTASIYPS